MNIADMNEAKFINSALCSLTVLKKYTNKLISLQKSKKNGTAKSVLK